MRLDLGSVPVAASGSGLCYSFSEPVQVPPTRCARSLLPYSSLQSCSSRFLRRPHFLPADDASPCRSTPTFAHTYA